LIKCQPRVKLPWNRSIRGKILNNLVDKLQNKNDNKRGI
jgi:hypothetical protein